MKASADKDKELISEESFQSLPQGFKDWVTKLGWKREEIVSVHVSNETLRDYDAEKNSPGGWQKWKRGKYVDIALKRNTNEEYLARFTRLSNDDWQMEEDYNVTAFPGRDEVAE